MWKFIVDVVHAFVNSLQPDVGRGFLHVSNVFFVECGPCCWKIRPVYVTSGDQCFRASANVVSPLHRQSFREQTCFCHVYQAVQQDFRHTCKTLYLKNTIQKIADLLTSVKKNDSPVNQIDRKTRPFADIGKPNNWPILVNRFTDIGN